MEDELLKSKVKLPPAVNLQTPLNFPPPLHSIIKISTENAIGKQI
jgi:hypothetical protein